MNARSKSVLLSLSSCFCYGIAVGFIRIIGVYFIEFQDTFNAPASQASLAISIQVFVLMFGGPLYAVIYNKIGPKTSIIVSSLLICSGYILVSLSRSILMVQICLGLFTGFGGGLANMVGTALVGKSFDKHRALANNMIQGSNNIVVLAAGPLLQTLIYAYSWRGAALIQGAIVLNAIPMAFVVGTLYTWKQKEVQSKILYKNTTKIMMETDEEKQPPKKPIFDWSLLKDICFFLFCIMSTASVITHMMKMMYLVRYAQSVGISSYAAVGYMSLVQALELVCTIASGLLASTVSVMKSNNEHRNPCCGWFLKNITLARVLSLLYLVQSVCHLLVISMETNAGFIVYSILLGSMHGFVGGLPDSVMVDFFGTERVASALGIRTMITGIAAISIPPFVGWIVDQVGNFRPVQYTSALAAALAGILLLIIEYFVLRRKSNFNVPNS